MGLQTVSASRHLGGEFVLESEIGAAVGVFLGDATCGAVHMALHDVAVQASVHQHGALHVHTVAHVEQTEVGFFQCLAHGSDGILVIVDGHHCEAYAVVADTLVDFQLVDK